MHAFEDPKFDWFFVGSVPKWNHGKSKGAPYAKPPQEIAGFFAEITNPPEKLARLKGPYFNLGGV